MRRTSKSSDKCIQCDQTKDETKEHRNRATVMEKLRASYEINTNNIKTKQIERQKKHTRAPSTAAYNSTLLSDDDRCEEVEMLGNLKM